MTGRASVIGAMLIPALLAGQDPSTSPGSLPRWMTRWSPLAPLVDLPRTLPASPASSMPSALAPMSIGLWWTAGVPGALPRDLGDSRVVLQGAAARSMGEYRQASDAADVAVVQATALGWQPIGSSGGAAGRVAVREERAAAIPYNAALQPHSTSPLVLVDTTSPRVRGLRTTVEGAFGWNLRGWGVGVAAALETEDRQTRDARFPRFGRGATPAIRAGLTHAIPFTAMEIAVYGRWLGGAETISLVPQTEGGVVFALSGYNEADSIALGRGEAAFFRRIERTARAGGVAVAGNLSGIEWVILGERGTRLDQHFSARMPAPPTDRWAATGWTFAAAAQRRFGERALVTAEVRRASVLGHARRADLDAIIFDADENSLSAFLEVRYQPRGSPLRASAGYALQRERRRRFDYVARVGTDLVTWIPGGWVTVAYTVAGATFTIGASGVRYSAVGSIPDAAALGPTYQQFLAPDMTLLATPARTLGGTIAVVRRVRPGVSVRLDGWLETVRRQGAAPSLPFANDGRRTSWTVAPAVVFGQ